MKLADLDLNKTYTYADYFSWKFEERVELIEGTVFKFEPFSNRIHQKITGHLFVQIGNFIEKNFTYGSPVPEAYHAPFDVRFPRRSKTDKEIITVLQPDVCVICDLSKLDKRGCLGAPEVVVEVLSPGNNAKELKNKYNVYEEAGVKEYWVVSPQDQWLRIYTLTDGKFHESRYYLSGDAAPSTVLPGFSLDVTALFLGIPADE